MRSRRNHNFAVGIERDKNVVWGGRMGYRGGGAVGRVGGASVVEAGETYGGVGIVCWRWGGFEESASSRVDVCYSG